MKSIIPLSILSAAMGLAAVGKIAAMNTALPESQSEKSSRVNVEAVAEHLEFLGGTPELSGKPLLIEFWATWCGPCRTSIQHLNELHEQFGDNGLGIVGVANESKSVVERFQQHTPINYTVALDKNGQLASAFQVRAVPQAWLLDGAGKVVWSGHPLELNTQAIGSVVNAEPTS